MRAYVLHSHDAAPILTDVPCPTPESGEIRVKISACGLNFADLLMIRGTYQETPEPPFSPGMELCGTVDALGEGVTGISVGERVAIFGGRGGLAEFGCFDASRAVSIPDTMDDITAAGFQVAYGTSHLALDHRARLAQGETLLVLGAAGGVGLTAVEIGKLMGARVIACARGADKLETARNAGADDLIDADTDDLRGAIKALGGADVVYDPVGGAQFEAAFRACNPEGRLLTIGFASGDVPQIKANHMMVKNLSVMGLYWGGYLRFRPEILTGSLATLMDWHARGRLHPHVSHVLPLDRVDEGLALLRDRKSTGKIVITMGD